MKSTNVLAQTAGVGQYSFELTGLAADTVYTVKLVCDDDSGCPAVLDVGTIFTGDVSVTSGDNTSADYGTFIFTRSGSVGEYTINYAVGGTAISGTDYIALPGSVTFADGEDTVKVKVVKRDGATSADNATVTVTILGDISSDNAETITLADLSRTFVTSNFDYKIDFTVGEVTGTFTNFPVLVKLSKAKYPDLDWSTFAANGADLAFVDANGKLLAYEIDEWPAIDDGEAIIWVRIPVLATGTTFTALWGGDTIDVIPAESVWQNYGGVWHMNGFTEDSGIYTVADSSGALSQGGAAMDATSSVAPVSYPGAVGKGIGGSTASFELCAPDHDPAYDTNFEFSFWYYNPTQDLSGNNANFPLVSRKTGQQWSWANGWFIEQKHQDNTCDANRQVGWIFTGQTVTYIHNTPDPRNGWVYLQAFSHGGKNTMFLNGVKMLDEYSGTITSSDALLKLSGDVYQKDEMRLRAYPGSVAQADAWAAAEYASMADENFVTGVYKRQCGFFPETVDVSVDSGNVINLEVTTSGRGEGQLFYVVQEFGGNAVTNLFAADAESGESCTIPLTSLDPNKCWRIAALTFDGTEYNLREIDGWVYSGAVSIASGVNADYDKNRDGTFIVTRPAGDDSCATALVVNYVVGGTAEPDVDYVPLPGSVTIPAGQYSASIYVEPLYHGGVLADNTIVLTLTNGLYKIGASNEATIDCIAPTDKWTLNGSQMTDGFGWVLNCSVANGTNVTVTGVAPTSQTMGVLDLAKGFTVRGPQVVEIGNTAFSGKSYLTDVLLPDTLKRVGYQAFYNCANLTTITPFLPDSVTYVAYQAFYNCSKLGGRLELGTANDVTIQPNGDWARNFMSTKITELVLGDGVTSIPPNCFNACASLTNIVLGANLEDIGYQAFVNCSNLEKIEPFFPDKVNYIAQQAFNNCPKLGGRLVLGMATNVTIQANGDWARQFMGSKISEIVLGDGVTSIPAKCFYGCSSLTNLTLGANLTSIGFAAFYNCTSLEKVEPLLPDSVTSIEYQAFYNCTKLGGTLTLGTATNVTIQESGDWAREFGNTLITRIVLGPGVTSIPKYAFLNCTACKEVVFLGDKPSWDANAFNGWGNFQSRWLVPSQTNGWATYIASTDTMTPVAAGSSDETTYKNAYTDSYILKGYTKSGPAKQWIVAYDLNDEDINLSISGNFNGKKSEFGTVTPPYGIYTNLANNTEWSLPLACSAPQYVVVGNSRYECTGYILTDDSVINPHAPISNNALSYSFNPSSACSESLTWQWTGPVAYRINVIAGPGGSVVTNTAPDGENFHPAGSSVTYTALNVTRWMGAVPEDQRGNEQITIVADAEKTIMPYFESGWIYDSGASTIADGYWVLNVKSLGDGKLQVTGVKSRLNSTVDILDLRKGIVGGDYVITSIGNGAFNGQTTLKKVLLPDTLTSIGSTAFNGCSALETVTPFLPQSVTSLGMQAFNNCAKLTGSFSFGYGDGAAEFGKDNNANANTFYNAGITEVHLGPGVTKIYSQTFRSCKKLLNVELPEGLTAIGWYAFLDCSSLTNVVPFLPESVAEIGVQAFDGCTKLSGNLRLGHNGTMTFGQTGGNSYAFRSTAITGADIGPGVTAIHSYTFYGCSEMKNLALSEGLTSIGWYAFQNCSSLTNVAPLLPDTLTGLGVQAFDGCGKLKGVLRLGMGKGDSWALSVNGGTAHQFRGSKIEAVHIGERVANIPYVAFDNCKSLKRVYWYGTEAAQTANSNAFNDNDSLQICHFIPKGYDCWDTYIEGSCTTNPAVDISDFHTKFPEVKRPAGQIKLPSGSDKFQYYTRWNPKPLTTVLLMR